MSYGKSNRYNKTADARTAGDVNATVSDEAAEKQLLTNEADARTAGDATNATAIATNATAIANKCYRYFR
jgi:hypothetical protein